MKDVPCLVRLLYGWLLASRATIVCPLFKKIQRKPAVPESPTLPSFRSELHGQWFIFIELGNVSSNTKSFPKVRHPRIWMQAPPGLHTATEQIRPALDRTRQNGSPKALAGAFSGSLSAL
jgi:hypothetical protein